LNQGKEEGIPVGEEKKRGNGVEVAEYAGARADDVANLLPEMLQAKMIARTTARSGFGPWECLMAACTLWCSRCAARFSE
jgi:hypothetical protein